MDNRFSPINGSSRDSGIFPTARLKPSIPSRIDAPSFSAFQAQNPRVDSPLRRKPLPSSAATRGLSSGGTVVAVGEGEYEDLPHNATPLTAPWLVEQSRDSPPLNVRDLDQFPRGHSPRIPQSPESGAFSPGSGDLQQPVLQTSSGNTSIQSRLNRSRLSQSSESLLHGRPRKEGKNSMAGPQRSISLHPPHRPSSIQLHVSRHSSHENGNEQNDSVTARAPKQTGSSKLTSFFGWKTSSPIAETFSNHSDKSYSPVPSPLTPSPQSSTSNKPIPRAIDVPKANAAMRVSYFGDYNHFPPPSPSLPEQINEMEEGLREVCSELAGSVRREIELEDLVERLQFEATQGPDYNRRTSDYYSDSGTSSRYPGSDFSSTRMEEYEKQKRRSEQEKAQFKVDLFQKLQIERSRRKALENHIEHLEEQVHQVRSLDRVPHALLTYQLDRERAISSSASNRIRDLEGSLDDVRRRLSEEKRTKENFEDLLTALRGEIEQHRNERDNLRDKVVPQLRARVEGLETGSADSEILNYENARMQQEIQSLRNENTTLINARRLQLDMQQQMPRIDSIAEEGSPVSPGLMSKMGLSRANSLARGMGGNAPQSPKLGRSNSISAKERESRESLTDRVKDIENQRDALHRSLRSLLDRQKYQNREHEKMLRALERERDYALQGQSPRRMGYEKEVNGLRDEIHRLRKRTDDVLMQKWQCEKGLGGLKKDLDRAEQETSSLRALLQEHDILVPDLQGRSSQDLRTGGHATSASLQKAYKDLQYTQDLSIARLRELRSQAPSSAEDAQTEETMDLLLKSMSNAEAERDLAHKEAEAYRLQATSLQEIESYYTVENAGLADELRASANRAAALATQMKLQLDTNSGLRQRLAEAVGRGEREQKNSTARINDMQGKLKSLEDKLMVAQQHSEEIFAHHEQGVREMKERDNIQLHRLKGSAIVLSSPKNSPISPLFNLRSPRLEKTTSGVGMSISEAIRTEVLEKKVAELEKALGDADREMEEVVGRMNEAQIEVVGLQSARDDAILQTKKLQSAIVAEREKVDALMR